ncbi:MAG: hypothetical protein V7L25_29830 [Nostoc sp.]
MKSYNVNHLSRDGSDISRDGSGYSRDGSDISRDGSDVTYLHDVIIQTASIRLNYLYYE